MENITPKILIIDDRKETIDILSLKSTKKNYQIFTAKDGEEGIKKIIQKDVDLIIYDMKALMKDGEILIEKIKKINPNIDIIISLEGISLKTAIESLRKSAFGFISKPIDIEKLSFIVSKAYEIKQLKSQIANLKAADKIKDTFLSFVLHELKTPIMIIKNTLELLLSKAWKKKDKVKTKYRYYENTKKLLEIIDRNINRMQDLVINTLDFYRIDSGLFVLKKRLVSTKKIIN